LGLRDSRQIVSGRLREYQGASPLSCQTSCQKDRLLYRRMDPKKTTTATDAVERARAAFDGFPDQWQIASRAIERLATAERVVGLYLSGSFAKGKPDRWSDIDLYVVVPDGTADEVIGSHERLIRGVGDLATMFPATHLGDPHQIIVFYRAGQPIHVDYQYRELGALMPRRQDSNVIVLLDRTGEIERWRQACRQEPDSPGPTSEQLQYLEVRFWGWCWYTHAKIERGELWEAREALEYLRSNVLLLLAHSARQVFEGNRRIEQKLPPEIQDLLASTIPARHSASSYSEALDGIIDAYLQLFDSLPPSGRAEVQLVDRDYFRSKISKH
jgi:hypothetical protein